MRYYPALLDIKGKICCVIGAGTVAQRKVNSLLNAGANVCVISPTLTEGLKKLFKNKKISWIKSGYRKDFIKRAFLVVAATNDNKINRRVWRDAQKLKLLANIVDSLSQSNFIVPAVIEKDGLIISISTSGKAPCLAKKIRVDLAKQFLPRYAKSLKLLEEVRRELKSVCPKGAIRKSILTKLINSNIIEEYIKRGSRTKFKINKDAP